MMQKHARIPVRGLWLAAWLAAAGAALVVCAVVTRHPHGFLLFVAGFASALASICVAAVRAAEMTRVVGGAPLCSAVMLSVLSAMFAIGGMMPTLLGSLPPPPPNMYSIIAGVALACAAAGVLAYGVVAAARRAGVRQLRGAGTLAALVPVALVVAAACWNAVAVVLAAAAWHATWQ